jgi:hypothetical protein
MSNILKNLISSELESVLLKEAEDIEDGDSRREALVELNRFIDRISTSISIAVATYLRDNVTVTPGQTVTVTTAGTAAAQQGSGRTTTPGTLRAL